MKVIERKLTKQTKTLSYLILFVEMGVVMVAILGITAFFGFVGVGLSYASIVSWGIVYSIVYITYNHGGWMILIFIIGWLAFSGIRMVDKGD